MDMKCEFCGTELPYDKLNSIIQLDLDSEDVFYMKQLCTVCDLCICLVYDYIKETKERIESIQKIRNALHDFDSVTPFGLGRRKENETDGDL